MSGMIFWFSVFCEMRVCEVPLLITAWCCAPALTRLGIRQSDAKVHHPHGG